MSVGALTRVEGEGALHVTPRDGAVDTVELNIYEPPQFFEAFLRRRNYTEPPDITATRHHHPGVWHLPGRLPGERLHQSRTP